MMVRAVGGEVNYSQRQKKELSDRKGRRGEEMITNNPDADFSVPLREDLSSQFNSHHIPAVACFFTLQPPHALRVEAAQILHIDGFLWGTILSYLDFIFNTFTEICQISCLFLQYLVPSGVCKEAVTMSFVPSYFHFRISGCRWISSIKFLSWVQILANLLQKLKNWQDTQFRGGI